MLSLQNQCGFYISSTSQFELDIVFQVLNSQLWDVANIGQYESRVTIIQILH